MLIANLILQNDGIVHGVHGLQSFCHKALCFPCLELTQGLQSTLKLVPEAIHKRTGHQYST